jgi:hypothetical protein
MVVLNENTLEIIWKHVGLDANTLQPLCESRTHEFIVETVIIIDGHEKVDLVASLLEHGQQAGIVSRSPSRYNHCNSRHWCNEAFYT